MQFNLANLVDLALGVPQQLNCENFNLLHTLLHVILRKTNLSDVCIELGKEYEEKIEPLLKALPSEPSICFKEYNIKPDGVKMRKKSCRPLAPRKSLTLITKKWPKCCPQSSSNKNDSKPQQKDFTSNNSQFQDDTSIIKNLSYKVTQMEKAISKISSQFSELTSNDADKSQQLRNPNKCELKVNIHNNIEGIDSDSDITDESGSNIEMNYVKAKILELSDSLKMHSNCLKKLKCEELPVMKSQQNEFMEVLSNNIMASIGKEKSEILRSLSEVQNNIESLAQQFLCVNEKIEKIEANFEDYKKQMDDEISSFKLMIVEKRNENLQKSSDEADLIIKTQNYQNSENLKSESSMNICGDASNLQKIIERLLSSSSLFDSQNDSCSFTPSLRELQKQVTSQSTCMHQLARDMKSKVDKCEYEICCRELNDLMDAVMQLKRDINNSPVAAGCSMPLMKNMNCISCQASANMTITSTTVPKLPSLKFGYARVNSECPHQVGCGEGQGSNRMKCFRRKACGSHTKINRRCNVSRMRYKRLGTPFKCSTPIVIYKNRCRKNFTNF